MFFPKTGGQRDRVDTRPSSNGFQLQGTFKNFNTIEEFRSPEAKKAVFDKVAGDASVTGCAMNMLTV